MTRALVLAIALLAPAIAHADDEIVRGAVVKIEAKEIYVNLGSDRGVGAGGALRIKRAVTLHHPVTHAKIDDWIPIGSASVTESGGTLSRAVVGDLVEQIRLGDIVEVYVDRPDTKPAVVAAPQQQGIPTDPVTVEVLGLSASLAGTPLEPRIAAWERYLSIRPSSPYGDAIKRDLEALRALRDEVRPRNAATIEEVLTSVAHTAPETAFAGVALPVVFVLDRPERVASAYLHYRAHGARTYKSVLLVREHDIYLRGAIPAEAVQPPGVDYFVEVSAPNGQAGLALGTPAAPVAVVVAAPTLLDRLASVPGRSSVQLSFDYLNFASLDRRSGDRTDRLVTATVDFTYRLPGTVESLGVGYGVYAGTGGFADTLWTAAEPAPKAAFRYGYADAEVGQRAEGVHMSVGGQLIAGVGEVGFGFGAEGRVRIGDREGTNLAIIGRTIDRVGFVSGVRFGTHLVEHLLLGVSVAATDQPNNGDIAVRLATDVEIFDYSNVSVTLRASWQGRSTDHGGLGGGGGVRFTW